MFQKRIMYFTAFVAMVFTAISLIISVFVEAGSDAARVCDWIAFVSMMLVVAGGGYLYARSKRNLLWMLLYLVVLAVIIVFRIIPLFQT